MVLLATASHMAVVGTAEYAIDFVQANMWFRETLSGGVRVMHGIPFLWVALATHQHLGPWQKSINGY
jgi:hypothetical protein